MTCVYGVRYKWVNKEKRAKVKNEGAQTVLDETRRFDVRIPKARRKGKGEILKHGRKKVGMG